MQFYEQLHWDGIQVQLHEGTSEGKPAWLVTISHTAHLVAFSNPTREEAELEIQRRLIGLGHECNVGCGSWAVHDSESPSSGGKKTDPGL